MSRKTSRNASNNVRKGIAPTGIAGTIRSRIALPGLALGSLTFAVSGALHAQNASSASGADNARAPAASSKEKPQARRRRGKPAPLHLAARTGLPADGAGLVAQTSANQTGSRIRQPRCSMAPACLRALFVPTAGLWSRRIRGHIEWWTRTGSS